MARALTLALLSSLLAAAPATAIPPMESLSGEWKKGDKWVVEYRYEQPSAAGVADPAPARRTRSWRCEVTSTNPRLLEVTSDDEEQQLVLQFDIAPPHALASGTLYGRNFARERVRLRDFQNPNPGHSFFLEVLPGPLIASHPALGGEVPGVRQTVRPLPDGRYEIALAGTRQTVTFVWSPGARWWSEAWSGAVTATARLDPFPRRGGPLPERLATSDVVKGTGAMTGPIKECGRRAGEHALVQVTLTIAPDGTVTAATATGKIRGETMRCIEDAARQATFPQAGSPLRTRVAFRLD